MSAGVLVPGNLWRATLSAGGLRTVGSGVGGWTPAELLTASDDGIWGDVASLLSAGALWQDSARTTPVANSGDPVGYVDDLSGYGRDLAQSTAASRLIYQTQAGLHWLECNGVNQFLSTAPYARSRAICGVEGCIFVAFRQGVTSGTGGLIKSLGDEYEAGACLVNFGEKITFHITDMDYWNPYLISFEGFTEDGSPVELIQHVNQISILLMKVKRKDKSEPKRPIGFGSWEEYEASKE